MQLSRWISSPIDREKLAVRNWRRFPGILIPLAIVALILGGAGGAYALYLAGKIHLPNQGPTMFESSFESGEITCRRCNPDGWAIQDWSGQPDAMVVSDEFPVRDGKYSLRVRGNYDDPWDPKPRVELSAHPHNFFEMHTEYWVGMSIYLPDDGGYEFDSQADVLMQVHGLNDDCDAGGMGPMAAIRPQDGRWRWDVRWDPAACMGSTPAGQDMIDMGPQERGRWTDFVIRFVFSHEDDGITQVWLDGKLVVDRVGMPNHYNNERGPYLKIGFYKAGWLNNKTDVTTRTVYFDAIRVYEGSDGYDIVNPDR